MRVMRALVTKELREHLWVFFGLTVSTLLLTAALAFRAHVDEDGVGGFVLVHRFFWTAVPLLSLALGNRLVVREYRSMTQLFVETLPVSRVAMISVKFWLGLVFISCNLAFVGLVDMATVLYAEGLSPTFVSVVAAKALASAALIWSLFFLLAFLGRYRWLIFAAAVVGLSYITSTTELELSQHALFALVDSRLATDQDTVPWLALGETLGITAFLAGVAHGLGLVREGSVAARLAQEMSQREKITLVGLALTGLLAFMVLDEHEEPAPYEAPRAEALARDGVLVTLVSGSHGNGQDHAEALADELSELRAWLGWKRTVHVYLAHRFSLDPGVYQRGYVDDASGLIVRANLTHEDFDPADFHAWVIAQLIEGPQNKRVFTEDRAWVRDGFPNYWVSRQGRSRDLQRGRALLLGALYAVPDGPEPEMLRDWFHTSSQLGPEVSAALAWSGLRVIERRRGAEAVQHLVRDVLKAGRSTGSNVWRDWRRPQARVLQETTGLETDALLEAWGEELRSVEPALRAEASALPRITATWAPSAGRGASRVGYTVDISPAPASGTAFTMHAATAEPLQPTVPYADFRSTTTLWKEGGSYRSDRAFGSGSRVMLFVGLQVDSLGMEVVSPQHALVMP